MPWHAKPSLRPPITATCGSSYGGESVTNWYIVPRNMEKGDIDHVEQVRAQHCGVAAAREAVRGSLAALLATRAGEEEEAQPAPRCARAAR